MAFVNGRFIDWLRSLTAKTTTIDGTEQVHIDSSGLSQKATTLDLIRYVLANGFGATDLNIANRIYIKAATKTLTESSATGVFDVTMASNSVASGTLVYSIQANDATDYQSLRGRIEWAAVNKAGTLNVNFSPDVQANQCSAGTLTASVTGVAGTGKITLSITAVSSLTQTVLRAKVKLEHDGNATITAL
jgi:hypothetical protein